MKADRTYELKENFLWTSIGLGLKGLASTLMRIGKKDPWLERALYDFTGVYRFENVDGSLGRYLIFRGRGRVTVAKRYSEDPDFTVTLRQPRAFGKSSRPEHALEMVISNKIAQSGNMHYLCQFGFILSLLQRYFREKRK